MTTFIETKFCDATDELCPDCEGRGWKPFEFKGEPQSRECIRCGGTGKRAGSKPCGQALTRAALLKDGVEQRVIYFCTKHRTRKRFDGPETIEEELKGQTA